MRTKRRFIYVVPVCALALIALFVGLGTVGTALAESASGRAARIGRRIPAERYIEAIKTPRSSFSDPRLQTATFVQGQPLLGKAAPWFAQGGVAVVFHAIDATGKHWAVRCFTTERNNDLVEERHLAIERHLASVKLPYLVERTYQREGIAIDAKAEGAKLDGRSDAREEGWYPIEMVPWVEGEKLDTFLSNASPTAIATAVDAFPVMMTELRNAGIGHGDLHPDNMFVDGAGKFTLIDYDGMSVPEIESEDRYEVGVPRYRHPYYRTELSPDIDNFPAALIQLTLLARQHHPELFGQPEQRALGLWARFGNILKSVAPKRSESEPTFIDAFGNETLFTQQDIANPQGSKTLGLLRQSKVSVVRNLASFISGVAEQDHDITPPLAELLDAFERLEH